MEELKLPTVKLNPDELDIKSEEELAAAQQKEQGGNRLRPGLHHVTVTDVKSHGPSQKDKTWMQLEFVLTGADDKTANPRILVPFKKLKYGEKGTTFPLVKFREFMAGFGVEFKVEDTLAVVQEWFSKVKKSFIGKELEIEIGFRKAHAQYIDKDEDGNSIWHLIDKEGKTIVDDSGEALVFPKREAVQAYAGDNNIPFAAFSDILKYSPVDGAAETEDEDF